MDPAFFVIEQDAQRSRLERHRENSGRLAQASATYVTTGHGELVVEDPLAFGATFTYEPTVTFGAVVERLPDSEYFKMPRITAGVLRWQRNERGFFVGAWMYFTVDCPARELDVGATDEERLALRQHQVANPPNPTVVHHLLFRGVAYKALPQEVVDEMRLHHE